MIWEKIIARNTLRKDFFCLDQLGNKPRTLGLLSTLLKFLSFDLIRLLCASGIMINNDATTYQNHIISSFFQLCYQQLRLPQEAVAFFFLFLKTVKHCLKAFLSMSSKFHNNMMTSVFGFLQGSRLAPAKYLVLSLLLIKTCNKN